jgi:hypothetical protein
MEQMENPNKNPGKAKKQTKSKMAKSRHKVG